jgi:hypothetical protein
MWIIDLPRVGTADDPTPCLGDARFTEAKTAKTVRACQAICLGCNWQAECNELAQALLASGEQITGVWAGVHHGVDYERRADEHPDDRGGRDHRSVPDHPPRVVRIVGHAKAGSDSDEFAGAIPTQRNGEPW